MFLSTNAIRNVYLNNTIYGIVIFLFFVFSASFKLNEISKEIDLSLEKSSYLLNFFLQNTTQNIINSQINDTNTSFLFDNTPYLRAIYNVDANGSIININQANKDDEYVKNFFGAILYNQNSNYPVYLSKTKIYNNKDESIFLIIKHTNGYFVGEFDLRKLYKYFAENKILNDNTIFLDLNGNAIFKSDAKKMAFKNIYEYFGKITKENSINLNLNNEKTLSLYKISKDQKYNLILFYKVNFFDTFLPSFLMIIFMITFFVIMFLSMHLTIKSLKTNLLLPISNLKDIIKNIRYFNIKKEDIAGYKTTNENFNRILDDIIYVYKKYQNIRQFLKNSYYKDSYIFNKSSLIILIIDAYDGSIVDVSKGGIEFYKYTKKELLTKSIFDINLPLKNDFELQKIKYPYKKRITFKAKHILANKSIKDVLVETSYITIQNVAYQMMIIRDITSETNLINAIKQEHQILDISPFLVFNFSDKNLKKVDFVSYTVTKILGYTQEEIINEKFDIYDILHPDDLSKIVGIFKTNMRLSRVNDVNTQFVQPCRILHKNGTYIWFNLFFKIFKDDKKSIQTVIYAIDYSDILKQKNTLETRIKRYKNFLLSCDIVAFEMDLEKNTISFSENLSSMLKLDLKDKIISMDINSFKQLVNKEDFKKLDCAISENANYKKDYFKEEIRISKKDGEEIWLLVRGQIVLRNENKDPLIICGGAMDISFKKKFENLAILHREVFLNSTQGMIIADKNSIIIETNRAFDKFFGYKNAIGKSLKILKSAKNDAKTYKRILDYLRDANYCRDILWIKTAYGESILSMFSVTKIKDNSNNVQNYIISFHTMSENAIN